MKRSKPKQVSDRGRLIKKIDKIFFEILKIERGAKCEICGRTQQIAPFHILDKGRYPRLRWHKENVLLTCWFNCHYSYHHYSHQDLRYQRVIEGIKKLRGNNYWNRLLVLHEVAQPLKMFMLYMIYAARKKELKELR